MMEQIKGFLKLIRWFHEVVVVIPFVALFMVIQYAKTVYGISCDLSGFDFAVLCFCVQLLIAKGCVLNDIMDHKIDRINKPQTHLIGRVFTLRQAWGIFLGLSGLIVLVSVYIVMNMFVEWGIICLGVYVASVLYDVYFKRSPLMGNILIAGITAFIPLVILFFARDCLTIMQNENIYVLVYMFSYLPFMIIIPRELSLDISDMEGDRADGCKTFPLLIGVQKSKHVVTGFLIATVLSSVPLVLCYEHLLLTWCIVDVLLLVYLFQLYKCIERIDYIKAGRFLWFIMIVGLIGFTCSTLYTVQ